MQVKLDICDKCGKILCNDKEYSVKSFLCGLENGGYRLCYDCWFEICKYIDDKCFYKGGKALDDFIKAYNNKEQTKFIWQK